MQRLPLPEVLVTITDDLDRGFTTEQIASDVGVQYLSLLRRLDRAGEFGLSKRLQARRALEAEPKRQQAIERWRDRPRCTHGAWSSTPGVCEHDMMGRHHTIAPRSAA